MEKEVDPKPSVVPSGGLIRLQARASDLVGRLGPTWAALCGVIASGGFIWQEQDWLRLAFLILLVDGGWGTLWAALGGSDWATPFRRWREGGWRQGRGNTSVGMLPYTLSGAPGGRLRQWLNRVHSWWREVIQPICGSSLLAILAALLLTALLGAFLGPELLLLSVAALAMMQLGVVWEGGQGAVSPRWDALISVALPWLAGHATFRPVTLGSATLAVLFALAWGNSWRVTSAWGRVLAIGSQLVAMATLVALHRPLAAGALFLLLVPQLMLLPWTQSSHPAAWYVRYTRPWLMAATALAAFALVL
jgi:hypothetical protein